MKKPMPTNKTTAATAPMAMPAMLPPERSLSPSGVVAAAAAADTAPDGVWTGEGVMIASDTVGRMVGDVYISALE